MLFWMDEKVLIWGIISTDNTSSTLEEPKTKFCQQCLTTHSCPGACSVVGKDLPYTHGFQFTSLKGP